MAPPMRARAPILPVMRSVELEPSSSVAAGSSSVAAGSSSAGAGVSWSKRVGSLIPTNPSIESGHPQA